MIEQNFKMREIERGLQGQPMRRGNERGRESSSNLVVLVNVELLGRLVEQIVPMRKVTQFVALFTQLNIITD